MFATIGAVREGGDRDPARGHGDERRLHLRLHGRRVPRRIPPRLGKLLRLPTEVHSNERNMDHVGQNIQNIHVGDISYAMSICLFFGNQI